jgi:hypothetical protein
MVKVRCGQWQGKATVEIKEELPCRMPCAPGTIPLQCGTHDVMAEYRKPCIGVVFLLLQRADIG